MWKIHGKVYNLDTFLDKHPGGRSILEAAKDQPDLTAAFESYHALCDMDKINTIMKKYEVGTCGPSLYTFNETGFYKTLVKEVKKSWNRHNSKWNSEWLFTSFVTFGVFLYTYLIAFWFTGNPFFIRCAGSIAAGTFMIQSGFQIYHDASHYAISTSSTVNDTISKFFAGVLLWDWKIWQLHHSIRHHSYTGHSEFDPDSIDGGKEAATFICKHTAFSSFIMSIFPGLWVGQCVSYIYGLTTGKLWNMKITHRKNEMEYIGIIFHIFMLIHGRSWILFSLFMVSININYSLAILPDHDTLETFENRKNECTDWGESQVIHTANFGNKNMLYTRLYGGINYQIEHHLFPTVCSSHLPKLKKTVVKKCKEFGIHYVEIPTILGAYQSSINNLYI